MKPQFFHSPISRRALVVLVALVWSSVAYCGEIHDAAENGDLEKVKALLKENPALVSDKDYGKSGSTPLHLAADKGFKDVAKLLLANKANVNATDQNDRTPLHHAAFEGQKNMAVLLLANKAEVNARDKYGLTPLRTALAKGHDDVAELLRQHGGHK